MAPRHGESGRSPWWVGLAWAGGRAPRLLWQFALDPRSGRLAGAPSHPGDVSRARRDPLRTAIGRGMAENRCSIALRRGALPKQASEWTLRAVGRGRNRSLPGGQAPPVLAARSIRICLSSLPGWTRGEGSPTAAASGEVIPACSVTFLHVRVAPREANRGTPIAPRSRPRSAALSREAEGLASTVSLCLGLRSGKGGCSAVPAGLRQCRLVLVKPVLAAAQVEDLARGRHFPRLGLECRAPRSRWLASSRLRPQLRPEQSATTACRGSQADWSVAACRQETSAHRHAVRTCPGTDGYGCQGRIVTRSMTSGAGRSRSASGSRAGSCCRSSRPETTLPKMVRVPSSSGRG